MTRRAHALLIALSLFPPAVLAAEPADWPEWVGRSRELTMQLSAQLKGELTRAIEQGGPVAAIAVCRDRAPVIAARLSQESGAKVGRTALRVRDPANAPDDLQRAVLEQFADELDAAGSARAAAGSPSAPAGGAPEAVFEIKRAGGIERRYMRAIPTDPLCLTCHGSNLPPELAAAIARDYPSDAATGYAPGGLRGAFSVIWPAVPVAAAPAVH
jgi:hypothetical protein